MQTPFPAADSDGGPGGAQNRKRLLASGIASACLYAVLLWLSSYFEYGSRGQDRPLLPVLTIFAVLFGLYVFQVSLVVRHRLNCLPLIMVLAVVFRLLLLFSNPIQEIDIYRYLWDGKAVAGGVNPFRYSPHQVQAAAPSDQQPADLQKLIQVRDRSPANAEVLARVHFGELTTVYPPVSQAVFAVAALVTPHSANVGTQLVVMKSVIVLFDLATLWLVIRLLQLVQRPPEWCITYAWCPLVLKEFANSGHLDAIAVCLTTTAAYCAVRALFGARTAMSERGCPEIGRIFAAHLVLALAVGAKIYPVVLMPLFFFSTWRHVGRGVAVSSLVATLLLVGVMVVPMFYRNAELPGEVSVVPVATTGDAQPPLPDITGRIAKRRSSGSNIDPASTGVKAFAMQWQMNDFLFLLLYENLKPVPQVVTVPLPPEPWTSEQPPLPDLLGISETVPTPPPAKNSTVAASTRHTPIAWFAVTPNFWRLRLVDKVERLTQLDRSRIPFVVTRAITGTVFFCLAVWFAARAVRLSTADAWLQASFLTIAWFWLLQPTQNPWYWTWALPLLPFAKSRAWLWMSGLCMLYYMRFWFRYHSSLTFVAGTDYVGVQFFDMVVTWIEYGPWFVWLWVSRSHRTAFLARL